MFNSVIMIPNHAKKTIHWSLLEDAGKPTRYFENWALYPLFPV